MHLELLTTCSAPLARRRIRRIGTLLVALAVTPLCLARTAAATPYASPGSPEELACNLARSANPDEYRGWWSRVPGSTEFRGWFWNRIVPQRGAGDCAAEVSRMFWEEAVPGNWDVQPAHAGWDWPDGGYFTQVLWLEAIPEDWGDVAPDADALPGLRGYYRRTFWLEAVPDDWGPRSGSIGELTGQGYYRYWFWRGAVAHNWGPQHYVLGRLESQGYYRYSLWQSAAPDNWASRPAFPGWRWSAGGYYTQTLWLQAIPQNWTAWNDETHRLGRDFYADTSEGQGHYRYVFWEHAVPDNWAWTRDRVGGWPWGEGGYYTQFFWWRAVPEDWVPTSGQAIGGLPFQGHYAFWLYHYAAPRGFAWRPDKSVRGSSGASYYMIHIHETLHLSHAEYAYMKALMTEHLPTDPRPQPVSEWFDDDASAVVVLTFDTEGLPYQTCNLADLLRDEGLSATFLLEGRSALPVLERESEDGALWRSCLEGFDLGNHTESHTGAFGYDVDPTTREGLLNMKSTATQMHDVLIAQRRIEGVFEETPASFRTPLCDGHRSFDGSIVDTLERVRTLARAVDGGRTIADSSVSTLSHAARAAGIVPPGHLPELSANAYPYPYEIGHGEDRIVEIPFSYPSDWTGYNGQLHGLALTRPPAAYDPADPDLGYLVNVWKQTLDEIRTQEGVMVLLMHPQVMGLATPPYDNVAGLRDFIHYAKDRGDVRFSTLAEVAERFRRR